MLPQSASFPWPHQATEKHHNHPSFNKNLPLGGLICVLGLQAGATQAQPNGNGWVHWHGQALATLCISFSCLEGLTLTITRECCFVSTGCWRIHEARISDTLKVDIPESPEAKSVFFQLVTPSWTQPWAQGLESSSFPKTSAGSKGDAAMAERRGWRFQVDKHGDYWLAHVQIWSQTSWWMDSLNVRAGTSEKCKAKPWKRTDLLSSSTSPYSPY